MVRSRWKEGKGELVLRLQSLQRRCNRESETTRWTNRLLLVLQAVPDKGSFKTTIYDELVAPLHRDEHASVPRSSDRRLRPERVEKIHRDVEQTLQVPLKRSGPRPSISVRS